MNTIIGLVVPPIGHHEFIKGTGTPAPLLSPGALPFVLWPAVISWLLQLPSRRRAWKATSTAKLAKATA